VGGEGSRGEQSRERKEERRPSTLATTSRVEKTLRIASIRWIHFPPRRVTNKLLRILLMGSDPIHHQHGHQQIDNWMEEMRGGVSDLSSRV
jgi:hypothetical protein